MSMTTPWWIHHVKVAEATIRTDLRFSSSGTTLRGSIVESLLGGDPEFREPDWHGHIRNGVQRSDLAPIMYRVHDGIPKVFAWGERAHDNILRLARDLKRLPMPEGDAREVLAVDLRMETVTLQIDSRQWHVYEFASPYFPSSGLAALYPGDDAPVEVQKAWASYGLRSSILNIYEHLGRRRSVKADIWVHLEEFRPKRVRWRQRGAPLRGFMGRFVTCAPLPDGFGLGNHRSEGWGEVRQIGVAKIARPVASARPSKAARRRAERRACP